MDIKSIQTLVSIADHRSFQAAATALDMSISNVSLQVQALEKYLGEALFDRSTRPPRLTITGIEFVSRSRKLLAQWEELSNSVVNPNHQGMLKIGAIHTAVEGGVAVALGQLRKRDPDLYLQLHTDLTTQLIRQLQNHSIDCAIITEPETSVADMQFELIAREELAVIAHHQAIGENYRQALENNTYLRFNRQATLAQLIDVELKKRGIKVNSLMEITTLDAISSLVENGLGVSVVPIGRNLRPLPSSIRLLPFTSPPVYRRLGLLFWKDNPRVHLIEILRQELIRAYGGEIVQ
ncbi:MAG: LysR substrate-binding domain-containing protein [Gammaproteobacteria bacterium]|nr:LysR substrate-binding domain-containing protein [Gammaproteobacteria bacterium]